MTNVLKSKLFLGLLCILLAAVIAFLVLPGIYASKSDTVTAAKLKQDVPAGTEITAAMLTTVEVGAYGLPDGVVQKESDAVGKIAADRLYTGEFLMETRLVTVDEYEKLIESGTKGLEDGMCLVTVKLPSASSGIAGILRTGNIVDVHEYAENEDGTKSVNTVLESMYVYDILNSDLESLSELDQKLESAIVEEDTDYDFEPTYVVFRCTQAQAQTFIRLERSGTMHLTLRRTGG